MLQRPLDFTEYKRHQLAKHLARHFEGEVRFDETSRKLYSTDASIYEVRPLGILLPKTQTDLAMGVQLCLELELPIIPRGAGTSVSGQSLGNGIVIDCSKYLNRVIALDPDNRRVVVEPGVTLDQLNRETGKHGLQFGASWNRGTLGGTIGNNSAGARSIAFGKPVDQVHRLQVLLSDGASATFDSLTQDEWALKETGQDFQARLYHTVRRITERNLDEIKRLRLSNRPPGIQGYHLDIFAEKFTPHQANPRPAGLHHLIVGSQGTLGFVTKADLNLVPMPRFVGFLVAHFQSLHAVSDALALCLEVRPRAVELLDGTLLNLLHCQDSIVHRPDLRRLLSLDARLLPPDYHVVVIEMSGDSETELRNELSRLKSQLQSLHSSANTIHVMENRKQGTGEREKQKSQGCFNNPCSQFPNLYSFLPGTIVEEMAIPLEAFSEFTTRFRKLLKSHELDGAYYGYVDHIQGTRGILHLCPVVSFTNTQDAQRMRQVVRDLTTLVRQGNGLQEGELSGDPAGIEWNSRTFSRQIYAAFGNVKGTFDPKNLFNPGKIVQSAPRDRTLRYGPECRPKPLETVFDYSSKDSETRLAHSVEKCNGSGECRKRQGGTMCPSYRVTLDEKDSTRGRANVLRMALVSDDPMAELQKEATHDVLDLCLMCKACKSECPMGIDMTKLKAEFLNIYHRKHLRPPRDLLTGWMFRWYRLGSFLPKTVNWGNRNSVIRWWLEQLGGIDRRRSLPLLHSLSFRSWMARHNPHPKAGTAGKVLLLDDCMMTYTEPEIGKAAVTILEATGHAVELVSIPCCGRPMINKGFLPSARKLIAGPISRLARRASDAKAILGLEPSCLLTLVDEWPDLIPTPQAKTIAAKTHLLDHWLVEQVLENRVHLSFREKPGSCLVHGHCHQKALLGAEGTADALRLIPQFEVTLLDTGCCGMAGSFGYEKEHYDLSVAIAKDDLIPKLKERPEGVVVAPGTACRQQIRDLTTRRVWHPLEILAQQLDFHPVNNHPLRSTEKPEPETSP